jgi:putative peptide zinc metalloprotease protein
MSEPSATFSESWYRIANQRLSLRADVIVQRQRFRGERWIVLQHPFASRFYRIRPAAYEFVARLSPQKTVQEVWQECVDKFPDAAPGQEAVLQLLSQLYFANLLHYRNASDAAQLFQRQQQRQQRETRARLLNVMFMRFPLLDPDRFLVRTLPFVGRAISWAGAAVWLVVVGWALKVAADNFPALRVQGEGVLAPGNLALLYAALVAIKAIHEFGHAYFCRKFGGEVHVMGVMLMIFTPIPYVDASSSAGFRHRWQRVLVGAAGMIVELFVAALATFVWAKTGAGVIHSLAYNVMFIASVSTLIFNANPLLRFDGYYILSDLLEIPNLSQRATAQLRHGWERHVFGVRSSESPASTRREAGWLGFYGVGSGIYRVIVFSGVLLIVADKFLIIGLLMAAVCLISWVTVPTFKFIVYLATSPRLQRVRWRAVGVTAGLAAALIVLLGVVPLPNHFRAPGVVQAQRRMEVVNDVAGVIDAVLAPPGSLVKAGQPLLQITSRELDLSLAEASARYAEASARLREALSRANADLKPLQSRLDSIAGTVAKLEADRAALVVRSRYDGVWVAPYLEEMVGRSVLRGTSLGLVVDPRAFEFVATVAQTDADAAFGRIVNQNGEEHVAAAGHGQPEVRIRGAAGEKLEVDRWRVVPGGQQRLPSAALGWLAGGEVPVAQNQPDQATEAFFEVRAELPASPTPALLHGRSGVIRFDLPAEPLLPRWLRRLGQLLQVRYQL